MKRLKNLWNTFCLLSTFVKAVYDGTYKKRKTNAIRRLLCEKIEAAKDGSTGREQQDKYSKKLSPEKVEAFAKGLAERVKEGSWKPSPPERSIRVTANRKVRNIAKALFEDHVVHWAIINTIKPALMRGMYEFCCGSVPNRGIKLIRNSIEKWVIDPDVKYFVKLDIRKFYDHINIDILMNQLARIIADRKILDMLRAILDMAGPGMPVGYYISPWLANYHLQEFDHYVMQGLFKTRREKRVAFVKHFARYIDDMLLMGSSKRDLEKAVRAIISNLRDNYGLTIKDCWEIKEIGELIDDGKGGVKCKLGTYPVDMGGYTFCRMRTKRGKAPFKAVVSLRDNIFLGCKRQVKKIWRLKRNGADVPVICIEGAVSRVGWAKHCNHKRFNEKYIKPFVDMNELKKEIGKVANARGAQEGINASKK